MLLALTTSLMASSAKLNFQISTVTEDTVDYLDVRTYQSPGKNFVPIRLQTYKELLRFGVQNSYILLPDGGYKDQKQLYANGTQNKNDLLQEGRNAFNELLTMHYLADVYQDIDKNLLTEYSSAMYEKDKNSYTSQEHLRKLAIAVTSAPLIYRYFCNPEAEECTYNPAQGYFRINNVGTWGGKGANQFQQLKAYRDFVRENFSSLQSWGASLIKGGNESAYFVLQVRPGQYDFKSSGFWLDFKQGINQGFFLRYFDLNPQNEHERQLAVNQPVVVLLSIAPEKAEKFVKQATFIYLVLKVKVTITGIDKRTMQVTKGFTLESPSIDLYTDEALANKFGELNINNLTIKN